LEQASLFQRNNLCIRINEPYNKELYPHHEGERTKGELLEWAAIHGNADEIIAFMTQCVRLPRLWPFERTPLGNTSLIYTQMEPSEKENEARSAMRNQMSSSRCARVCRKWWQFVPRS
jgi:hypothetical protein